MLRKSDEYFDGLLVSFTVQQEGWGPGTKEGWHSKLHRNGHFHGTKGLTVAEMELQMNACFYNCSVSLGRYEPVPQKNRSIPKPVINHLGNEHHFQYAFSQYVPLCGVRGHVFFFFRQH